MPHERGLLKQLDPHNVDYIGSQTEALVTGKHLARKVCFPSMLHLAQPRALTTELIPNVNS